MRTLKTPKEKIDKENCASKVVRGMISQYNPNPKRKVRLSDPKIEINDNASPKWKLTNPIEQNQSDKYEGRWYGVVIEGGREQRYFDVTIR